MIKVAPQPLSNIQVELLQLCAAGIPDEQLAELKNVIAQFLFDKARDEEDLVWKQKQYNQNTISSCLNED